MRRVLFFLCVLSAAMPALCAQGDQEKGLVFGISAQPEEGGAGFQANLGYVFSPRFRSGCLVRRHTENLSGPLSLGTTQEGEALVESSLNLDSIKTTEVFFMPAEFTFPLGGRATMELGLGAYLSAQDELAVGYFELSEAGMEALGTVLSTNSYTTEIDGVFYGPAVQAGLDIDLGIVSLSPQLIVAPVFFFTQGHTLGINPLFAAWDPDSIPTFEGMGMPYVLAELQDIRFPLGRIFGQSWLSPLAIGGDLSLEYSRQDARTIAFGGSSSAPEWLITETTQSLLSLGFVAQVYISLGTKGWIQAGVGAKRTVSTDEGTNASSQSSRIVYSLAYDLKR